MIRVTAYVRGLYDCETPDVLDMDKTFCEYHKFLQEALSNGYRIVLSDRSSAKYIVLQASIHSNKRHAFIVSEQDFYNESCRKHEWDFAKDAPMEALS